MVPPLSGVLALGPTTLLLAALAALLPASPPRRHRGHGPHHALLTSRLVLLPALCIATPQASWPRAQPRYCCLRSQSRYRCFPSPPRRHRGQGPNHATAACAHSRVTGAFHRRPAGIVAMGPTTLLVADSGNNVVRLLDLSAGSTKAVAGVRAPACAYASGAASPTQAQFWFKASDSCRFCPSPSCRASSALALCAPFAVGAAPDCSSPVHPHAGLQVPQPGAGLGQLARAHRRHGQQLHPRLVLVLLDHHHGVCCVWPGQERSAGATRTQCQCTTLTPAVCQSMRSAMCGLALRCTAAAGPAGSAVQSAWAGTPRLACLSTDPFLLDVGSGPFPPPPNPNPNPNP